VDQLRALALMFLELNTQAANIYLVFFGVYCLLIGYLIFRSAFLPRILGVLMGFAGLGWLTFLSPNSGRADGVCRFGLAELSVTTARQPSVPLQSGLIRRFQPIAHRDSSDRQGN